MASYKVMNKDSSDHDRINEALKKFCNEYSIPIIVRDESNAPKNRINFYELKLRKQAIQISGNDLRPLELDVLIRLLSGKDYWTDARELVRINNPAHYIAEEDMAITYDGLRPCISRIRKAIKNSGYIIDTARRLPENPRLVTHYRIIEKTN